MDVAAGKMENDRGAVEQALADFLDEATELDAFLAALDEGDWDRTTPFADWSVSDVVRHLVSVDRDALLALTDRDAFDLASKAMQHGTSTPVPCEPSKDPVFARLKAYERQRIGMASGRDLLPLWRAGRRALETAALAFHADDRIGWFGPPMRISRLFAARQMEVWCYGQDVYDAFGVTRVNTDRIRQIVDFGVRTRRYSFDVNGLDAPPPPFVSLSGPAGDVWNWGDPLSVERIEGLAEQFALVATQRRNVADMGLEVVGAGTAKWMSIAQTIAGGPFTPPRPGLRV